MKKITFLCCFLIVQLLAMSQSKNDSLAILIIYGFFGPGKYVKFAAYILLFGLVVLLPIYLVLVIFFYQETYSFLNHLHRLVLNPVLMMLLIPAFYSQRANNKKTTK